MRLPWLVAAAVLVPVSACGPDETTGACKDTFVAGDLVVTEVFADYAAPDGGTGADDGKEWFEIFNNSDRPVSLQGVTVTHSKIDGSDPDTHVIDDITIAPGQFLTLGNATQDLLPPYIDYGYSADLGGLSNSGGGMLTLACGTQEIDSAIYEAVKSGRSRQLTSQSPPDYQLNDNPMNWCEAKDTEFESNNFGTPGQDNDCAPVIAGACSDNGVMRDAVPPGIGELIISELMPRPSAVGATVGQWVEIKALADVDLNGVALDRANDTAGGATIESPTCVRLAAGSYALMARSSDTSMNGGLTTVGTFSFSINPTSNADLQLTHAGSVIDAITWTASTSGRSKSLDPDFQTSTANDDPTSFCDAQTVYNGSDRGTPGEDNEQCPTVAPPGMCDDNGTLRSIVAPASGALVITEIMANPVTEPGQEWFEITNTGSQAFDLNGLGLDRPADTTPNGGAPAVVTSGTCKSLAPGGYALFARSTDPSTNGGLANVDATFVMSLVNSAGTIQVVDPASCTGSPSVCTTIYDAATWGTTSDGYSVQLQPGMTDQTANDTAANFCKSLMTQQYDGTIANYGTPKAVNVCQ